MYIWDIHGCTIPLTNTDPENHYFLEECRLPTHKFGGARVGLVYDLIIKNYSVIRYLLFDYIYINGSYSPNKNQAASGKRRIFVRFRFVTFRISKKNTKNPRSSCLIVVSPRGRNETKETAGINGFFLSKQ